MSCISIMFMYNLTYICVLLCCRFGVIKSNNNNNNNNNSAAREILRRGSKVAKHGSDVCLYNLTQDGADARNACGS